MAQILIAEDEAFTALALVDLLRTQGHTVRDAADGAQAIGILEAFEADVIVTDLMMPRVDGYALIQHVRSRPGKPIPIILITGVPRAKLPADLAYDGYLGKPVDHEGLMALIDQFAAANDA